MVGNLNCVCVHSASSTVLGKTIRHYDWPCVAIYFHYNLNFAMFYDRIFRSNNTYIFFEFRLMYTPCGGHLLIQCWKKYLKKCLVSECSKYTMKNVAFLKIVSGCEMWPAWLWTFKKDKLVWFWFEHYLKRCPPQIRKCN